MFNEEMESFHYKVWCVDGKSDQSYEYMQHLKWYTYHRQTRRNEFESGAA